MKYFLATLESREDGRTVTELIYAIDAEDAFEIAQHFYPEEEWTGSVDGALTREMI
jgi:hypothetical protein